MTQTPLPDDVLESSPASTSWSGTRISILLVAAALLGVVVWRIGFAPRRPPPLAIGGSVASTLPRPTKDGLAAPLVGGLFEQGRNGASDDVRPPRTVTLDPFQIDRFEVSNERFREFVDRTGFVTTAERTGYGNVFDFESRMVRRIKGADWRHPTGPQSTIAGRERTPVVQVSWNDAAAFASWVGKRLPSEAEFEFAARGGLTDCDYPWGSDTKVGGKWSANSWQGVFPQRPRAEDGFKTLAPVGSFPPNRFNVFDLSGNVREWCADWYAADYYQVGPGKNPRGPDQGSHRVIRGGSWMSPLGSNSDDIRNATVWAREHRSPEWSDDQTGFRCVR